MADEINSQIPSDEPKALNLVESASVQADRLTRENERMERNIKQLQEFEAVRKLGGRTEAKPQEVKAAEESPQDYAKRILAGKL